MSVNIIYLKKWKSPLGELYLYSSKTHLLGLLFKNDEKTFLKHYPNHQMRQESTKITEKAILQLKEYFAGKRKKFNLKMHLAGTEFQKKVWTALNQIPYGNTCSYKEQAQCVSSKNAGNKSGSKLGNLARAVGSANGKNPIAIIVPCHRVIGANGKLVGYASGLKIKSELLKLEGFLK